MSLVIDLALVGIIALCGWRGFRTGIINGVCWVLAIVIAIYGANLIATAYSGDFSDMLHPFALGVIENTMSGDDKEETEGETVIDPNISVDERDELDVYTVAKAVLTRLGLADGAADSLATKVAGTNDRVSSAMASELTTLLCDRVSYVAVFAIAFTLIAIIFTVIGNVFDLSFGIPGHENLNHVTGAALGVIRGILVVMVICCVGRYLGILIPDGVTEKTHIFKSLVEANKIASLLNI